MVSVRDLAGISNGVYSFDSYNGWVIVESEVKTLKTIENGIERIIENGFKAALYEKGQEKVIAYAGTDDDRDKYNDDAYIASGLIPPQAREAIEFFMRMHGYAFIWKENYDNYNRFPGTPEIKDIVLTGHSMGGALAAIVANKYAAYAVTFNAPGVNGLKTPYFKEWKSDKDDQVRHDDDNYDDYALILYPSEESKERIRHYSTSYDPVSFSSRTYRKGFGKLYTAASYINYPRPNNFHSAYQWVAEYVDRYDGNGEFDPTKEINHAHIFDIEGTVRQYVPEERIRD